MMLSFNLPTAQPTRFTLRTAGVVLHAGTVLLQRLAHEEHWFLPGGRVEALESTSETLLREMHEELGVSAQIERLLWIIENFFVQGERAYHEVGFYYRLHLPPDFVARTASAPLSVQEGDVSFVFQWFPLDQLPRFVYPTCIAARLPHISSQSNPSSQIEHIVHTDPASAARLAARRE
jgi:ADP-ribose pyrophosphatase YjhB (NUDIX family)